ncbi:MAG: hypothetical protein RLZZ124_189 [Cyanobacteriota bacterium]
MGRLLLVGNSRWHWASLSSTGGRIWHESGPPADRTAGWGDLEAWACVGRLPERLGLPEQRRVRLERVPLQGLPPWLGVDRALVGWQAWRRQQQRPVLVVDAGTCLSLTLVDGTGRFRGGRLSAGLALQLRSLGQATAALPAWTDGAGPAEPPLRGAAEWGDGAPWPLATLEAMRAGCLKACAGAIGLAWHDLEVMASAACAGGELPWTLWLTGGDAEELEPLLRQQGLRPVLAPHLALEALAALTGQEVGFS